MFSKISIKKKYVIKKKIRFYLLFTGILLICSVIFMETQIIPFEMKCVKKESKGTAIKILNNAVSKTIDNLKPTYNDIAIINYQENGEIKSIETNSVEINRIKTHIINDIQTTLDADKVYRFTVPLGAFTKINELSSFGPDIDVTFRLTGSVNCSIKSEFESAGINQTIHHIFLIIKADIITISPEFSKNINITSDYEIAQTVIIGNIPNVNAMIKNK